MSAIESGTDYHYYPHHLRVLSSPRSVAMPQFPSTNAVAHSQPEPPYKEREQSFPKKKKPEERTQLNAATFKHIASALMIRQNCVANIYIHADVCCTVNHSVLTLSLRIRWQPKAGTAPQSLQPSVLSMLDSGLHTR